MSQITSIQQAASELFATNYPIVVQRGIDESTWGALCNTVYPGANPDSIIMAVDYCRARKLDIMLKPVHLVPMQVKDARTNEKVWRDVPMPGIGMYRIQADRSGNYAGADEPEFGPTVTQEFPDPYTAGKVVRVSYPEWCKYTVYKFVNGQRIAFTSKEYWVENYATQSSKTECPNAMWKKRPYGQIAKCAEAQALRKAWPEIGSEPTAEEMEGKTFIHDERDVTPQPVRIAQSSTVADRMKAVIDTDVTPDVPQELTPDKKEKLNQLLSQMELCESIAELKSVADQMAYVGVLPDKERHHATEVYRKHTSRIKAAIEAEHDIPV